LYLFYTPDIAGGLYSLNEEESRHCLKVLRLANGEIIHLTDGRGNLFEAVIVQDKGKQCVVEVQANLLEAGGSQVAVHSKKSFGYRPYRLHIAIAPTKNIERFEWFLEKATEIGIDEITPLICEHSERRQVRTDRLEKVITAAMKQSLKAWHPELHEALDLKHFLAKPQDAEKYIAFITEGAPQLQEVCVKNRDAVVLIGPEGDFSQAEVDLAISSGYQVVSLGSSRLRTETAGIVACHALYLLNHS
jgi:16S rRNA (uracil1498-N3)-methyltransferase